MPFTVLATELKSKVSSIKCLPAHVTSVTFQKGNPKTEGVNGLTNEALLAILIHRTTFVNQQFPCEENMVAIQHLKQALVNFEVRTARRMVRGVEGTQTM